MQVHRAIANPSPRMLGGGPADLAADFIRPQAGQSYARVAAGRQGLDRRTGYNSGVNHFGLPRRLLITVPVGRRDAHLGNADTEDDRRPRQSLGIDLGRTMNLDTPIIAIDVEIMDGDGSFLSETVRLSDFAVDDVQTPPTGGGGNPDPITFSPPANHGRGFRGVRHQMRAFLYALTRAKVRDPRIRRSMGLDDFTMKTSDLQAIADAISDLPDDLTELLTEA